MVKKIYQLSGEYLSEFIKFGFVCRLSLLITILMEPFFKVI